MKKNPSSLEAGALRCTGSLETDIRRKYTEEHSLYLSKETGIRTVYFEGEKVGIYIPDIVINKVIFLELKCKPFVSKDDINQFWYYLTVTGLKLGFLINFGAKNGVEIVRRVHSK